MASNLDRLVAIFQIFNPDLWFNDAKDVPTSDSDLAPFFRTAEPAKEWNSNDVRNWKMLGYQYDGLDRLPNETNAQRISRLANVLKIKYPSTGAVVTAPGSRQFLGNEPSAPDDMPQVGFLTVDAVVEEKEEHEELSETAAAPPVQPPAGQQPMQPDTAPPATSEDTDGAPTAKRHRRYPDYLINFIYDRYVSHIKFSAKAKKPQVCTRRSAIYTSHLHGPRLRGRNKLKAVPYSITPASGWKCIHIQCQDYGPL